MRKQIGKQPPLKLKSVGLQRDGGIFMQAKYMADKKKQAQQNTLREPGPGRPRRRLVFCRLQHKRGLFFFFFLHI